MAQHPDGTRVNKGAIRLLQALDDRLNRRTLDVSDGVVLNEARVDNGVRSVSDHLQSSRILEVTGHRCDSARLQRASGLIGTGQAVYPVANRLQHPCHRAANIARGAN